MNIKPGENVGVFLDNKTDTPRTEEEMDRLRQAIADAVKPFDFTVRGFGAWKGIRRIP